MALPTNGLSDARAFWALMVVTAAGALLRAYSATGDLWVDEIWSLNQIETARMSGNPQDWLALFFHDNTHALNTLYLMAVGPDAPMIVYRLFAFLAGAATILVAAAVGWRHGPWEGVLLAVLVAVSYPFVHFSGEARGYAPMLLAAFAAFGFLETYLERPTALSGGGFVGAALFGLSAHLTFGVVLAGLGIWMLSDLMRQGTGLVSALARSVPLFGPPFVASVAYAAIAVDGFVIGGSTFIPAIEAVAIMAGATVGIGEISNPAALTIGLGCLAAAGILYRVIRGDRAWPAFAVIVIGFPAGGILAEADPYVLPRYFLAAAPVTLILTARCVGDLWRRGTFPRLAVAVGLAAFLIGNGVTLSRFFEHGRGAYTDAIRAIAEAAPNGARVAGHPDFSVRTMVEYHITRLGMDRQVHYGSGSADWLILGYHAGADAPLSVKRSVGKAASERFIHHATFPHWGLSGDTWTVYRRQ